MADQLFNADNPEDLEFIRAGAEKAVAAMGNDHRARAAMIYAHVQALANLMEQAGNKLSQHVIEAIVLELRPAYRHAFTLDTLNSAKVDGFDTPEIRAQALARTERGRMPPTQQRERLEYKVMTIALGDAQETACALGKDGWWYAGQSTPALVHVDNGTPFASSPPPPAVTLTFERGLAGPADGPGDGRRLPVVGQGAD